MGKAGRLARLLGRILLNAATAVSLLLLLAAIILGIRSYSWIDHFGLHSAHRSPYEGIHLTVDSGAGRFIVTCNMPYEFSWSGKAVWHEPAAFRNMYPMHPLRQAITSTKRSELRFLGHGAVLQRTSFGFRINAPCWSVLLMLGVLSCRLLLRRRRAVRTCTPGLCEYCGYDLRATPHRCPECGNVPCRGRNAELTVASVGVSD